MAKAEEKEKVDVMDQADKKPKETEQKELEEEKTEMVEIPKGVLNTLQNVANDKIKKISGRWITDTDNKNGLIILSSGVTEVLFYDDIDRLRDENNETEYIKTVMYEQSGQDNREDEQEEGDE